MTNNEEEIVQELITDPTLTTDLQIYEKSNNDLINLSFSKDGLAYEITPKFKTVLDQSRKLAEDSTKLLKGATAANVDADELSRIRDEMKPVKMYRKSVDDTMKDVRRVFNTTRDNFTEHITGLLDDANFDTIEKNEDIVKKLNKDVLALRKKQNWEDVEEAFNDALNMYPDLPKIYPNQLSFDTFANNNDKLVSGAKNWRLNDEIINKIKTHVTDVFTNNQIIERMTSPFEGELKKRYDSTGDIRAAMDLEDKFKKEEAAALKRQQVIIEQEAKRQAAELERKRLMEERAKKQAEEALERKRIEAENAKKKAEEEAARIAAEKAKPKVIPADKVASAPFGMSTPAPVVPEKPIAVQIADRVGFKNVAKRIEKEDGTLSNLEAMDLLHRFLNGVYEQESAITELISSPDQAMAVVKEFVNRLK